MNKITLYSVSRVHLLGFSGQSKVYQDSKLSGVIMMFNTNIRVFIYEMLCIMSNTR